MPATIQAMKIFVLAVETNSFTAAARSLLIDPASVSKAIKVLEAELGVLLFTRSTRSLKLTTEGARFFRDCVQVLSKYDEATQQFRADGGIPHGRLKVGIAPALTRRVLLRAIPAFQQQYPRIEIILLNVDDHIEIGEKDVDVVIRPRSLRKHGGERPESQGLVVRKLAQSRFVACASPEYLDRAGAPGAPDDLLRHQCVALVTMERDIQDEWKFVKSQVRQNVQIIPKLLVQGADAIREAGIAGCGIIRLSAYNVEDELRARSLVPVLPDWECSGAAPLVAIYRKTRPMSPQISAFAQYLMQAFQRYNVTSKPRARPPG
jgi:LysR family transcriptional regulator, regulator for bpeEF and oprC